VVAAPSGGGFPCQHDPASFSRIERKHLVVITQRIGEGALGE